MKNPKLKKIFDIVSTVLLYLFIAICIFGVIVTITAKKDKDGTATIFGTQMRVVLSPSMEKSDDVDVSAYKIKDIKTTSVIFIQVVPEDSSEADKWYDDLEVGDVLTFKYVYTRQETITHRISKIEEKPTGGYLIELIGDNRDSETGALTQVIDTSEKDSPNYVIGKVTGKSYPVGLFITALRTPIGLVCIVILPALVIMALEIRKILVALNADKKKKEDEEKERQQNEIDELKRKLAEKEEQERLRQQNELEELRRRLADLESVKTAAPQSTEPAESSSETEDPKSES